MSSAISDQAWGPTAPNLRIDLDAAFRALPPDVTAPPPDPRVNPRSVQKPQQFDTPLHGLRGAPESVPRDRAALVRLDGASAGQVFSVPREGIVVGRHPDVQVCLENVEISRRHARIFVEEGAWTIEDLGSRNGTFVDAAPVSRRPIHDGALVRFGPVPSFRFQLMDMRQEKALQRLFESSTHDALTGVHNRRYFEERLAMELAFATRHRTTLSVVLFDIDWFKRINDDHGHAVGDAALRHVAQSIRATLRTEDVWARWGGEEFALLLRHVGCVGAVVAAERVRCHIESEALPIEGSDVGVTVSAGVACLDECGERSVVELLAVADRRLYQAKREGRNCTVGVG